MDNNILDFNAAKKPWYKRAWKKFKRICSRVWEWIIEYWDVIYTVLALVWAYTLGILVGKILGLTNEENNKANYEAGRKKGFNEGYIDCTKDIKASGYQMYGGYGEDSDKVIIKKISEEVTETELDEQ